MLLYFENLLYSFERIVTHESYTRTLLLAWFTALLECVQNSVAFCKSWHQNFCKVHRMNPKRNPKNPTRKVPYIYAVHWAASPIFPSVSLYDLPFSRSCTFSDFATDSRVKISKCHKTFNFVRSPKIYNFIFHHDYLTYHSVWFRSEENWRSSVLKFLLPYMYM